MEDHSTQAPTPAAKTAAQQLYDQARQHLEAGDFRQAAHDIHRAVEFMPDDADYRKLCKQVNDKLFSLYSQFIRLHPDDPQPLLDRGELYLHQGTVAKALADYNRAIELLSQTIQAHPRKKQPYFARAEAYSVLELYTKAIEDYSTVLRYYPKDLAARFSRAMAYYQQGQFGHAVDDLSQCIQLDPSAIYYQFRGFAFYSQGDFMNAVADFTRVFQLVPALGDSTLLYFRGLSFFHNHDYSQALDDLTRCLDGLPSEEDRVNACLIIDTCRTHLEQ